MPTIANKWANFTLHNKIKACEEFMDATIVNRILMVKGLGNSGAHEGEEGDYTPKDIKKSLEAIMLFSLEIFYSFFVKNGFGNFEQGSWVPTVFSTLPPIYRVKILKKYYNKKKKNLKDIYKKKKKKKKPF